MDEFKIPQDAIERLKDGEILRRYVEEGKTFQEILEYSDEMMTKFYEVAHHLFRSHRYNEAADAFVFLTTLNPYVPEYWLGMGMCEQLNEEYQQAMVAYSMVIIGDRHQPLAHYHMAACYNALGDVDNSLKSIQKAIEGAGDQSEYEELKAQSQRAKERLRSKKYR